MKIKYEEIKFIDAFMITVSEVGEAFPSIGGATGRIEYDNDIYSKIDYMFQAPKKEKVCGGFAVGFNIDNVIYVEKVIDYITKIIRDIKYKKKIIQKFTNNEEEIIEIEDYVEEELNMEDFDAIYDL